MTPRAVLQVVYSPPTGGRRLLQDAAPAPAAGTPACAVNLANATTLASIITIAQQSAPTLPDETTRAALNQGLSDEQLAAVAEAIANLNSYVANAPGSTETELAQYYAETQARNSPLPCRCQSLVRCGLEADRRGCRCLQLVPQIVQLTSGAISTAQFIGLTTSQAINQALASSKLPGQLVPTRAPPFPASLWWPPWARQQLQC